MKSQTKPIKSNRIYGAIEGMRGRSLEFSISDKPVEGDWLKTSERVFSQLVYKVTDKNKKFTTIINNLQRQIEIRQYNLTKKNKNVAYPFCYLSKEDPRTITRESNPLQYSKYNLALRKAGWIAE
jgi:hypothetical protein